MDKNNLHVTRGEHFVAKKQRVCVTRVKLGQLASVIAINR